MEPMSSHKGPPDKPMEPEDMIYQKKLDIDAKMKKSILLNNPEAVEPQNLLKTEAYAKERAANDNDSLSQMLNSKSKEKEKFYGKDEGKEAVVKVLMKVDPDKRDFADEEHSLESATNEKEIRCDKRNAQDTESNYEVEEKKNSFQEKESVSKMMSLGRSEEIEFLTGILRNEPCWRNKIFNVEMMKFQKDTVYYMFQSSIKAIKIVDNLINQTIRNLLHR
jgi:hypothetical protein